MMCSRNNSDRKIININLTRKDELKRDESNWDEKSVPEIVK